MSFDQTKINTFHYNKLGAAFQLIAALALTPEELKQVYPSASEKDLGEWAEEMKEDLKNGGFKDQLVEVLSKEGSLRNTHPGFPLGELDQPDMHEYVEGLWAVSRLEAKIQDTSNNTMWWDLEEEDIIKLLMDDSSLTEYAASWVYAKEGYIVLHAIRKALMLSIEQSR